MQGTERKRNRETQRNKGKKEKQGRIPSAVLFVPRTKGGELANRLKEKEKELAANSLQTVRIVEQNGERLEHILTKKDPMGDVKCERNDCLLCLTQEKERGRCRKRGVVYKITCNECKNEGKECQYLGETARSTYLRCSEHYKDFQNKSEGSHMVRHMLEKHPDTKIEHQKPENLFKMDIKLR